MRRFFVEKIPYHTDLILIPEKEANHIKKVLRMKEGDRIIIFDGKGREFESIIDKLSYKEVWVRIIKNLSSQPLSPLKITLAQAVIKGPALDYILQKATELGVNDIVFFYSDRTVVKLSKGNLGKKMIRWQEIIKSASKQCGRAFLPGLKPPISFEDLVKGATNENTLRLILWEREENHTIKDLLQSVHPVPHVIAIVGPEGGFTDDEIDFAKSYDFRLLSIGRRVLRSDTASIALLSILQYEWGDLSLSL
ncbi:MAG: 16S rRNA (uracil(1498)-N(3))-methyltransferase [Deltaproteobacteria bacterium]|nr:16S rRNA (uracil(1498)-N(3))-methyltransferase [Deltaproteobacteria bacterium]